MIILTFDSDYMRPEWMDEFIQYYPELPPSTFFLHKDSREWTSEFHEISEHPTIENVLNYSTSENLGHSVRGKGIRSHSCVSSHMISVEWAKAGLLYQSQETRWNTCYPNPVMTSWGIAELPISYMDNQDFWMERNWAGKHEKFSESILKNALNSPEIFLFDFHPLHIALNTSSIEDYAAKKQEISFKSRNPWSLSSSEYGVRNYFEEILSQISEMRVETKTCIDVIQGSLN